MSRNAPRAGPPLGEEPARHAQQPAKVTEPRSSASKIARGVARPADELAVRRELRSWAAAAGWLNAHRFAAAVPGHLADALSRRGLVVWAAADREAA